VIKNVFLFVLFLVLGFYIYVFGESEQPPFETKDAAITENFREAFYALDQLSKNLGGWVTSGNNKICLDDPTLCIDSANDRVIIGSHTVGSAGGLGETMFSFSGVGSSTFTIQAGSLGIAMVWIENSGGTAGRFVLEMIGTTSTTGTNTSVVNATSGGSPPGASFNLTANGSPNFDFDYSITVSGTAQTTIGYWVPFR